MAEYNIKKNPNLVNGASAMGSLSKNSTEFPDPTASMGGPDVGTGYVGKAPAKPILDPTASINNMGGNSFGLQSQGPESLNGSYGNGTNPVPMSKGFVNGTTSTTGFTAYDDPNYKPAPQPVGPVGPVHGDPTPYYGRPEVTEPQTVFPPAASANIQPPANILPPSMPQPPLAPTGYSTARMDIPRFETWMGRQDAAREAARFFTDVWNADPQTKAKLSAEYGGVTKKGNLKFFKTQQEVLANPLFGGEAPWHNLAVQGAAAFGGDEEAFMEWANDMVAEEATRAMEQTGKQEIVSGEQGAVLPVQIGDVISSDPKHVIDDAAIAKLNLEHPDWKVGETSQVQQDLALKFNQNSAIMKQGTTPEAKDAAFQQILDDYGKGLVSEGAFQQVLTSNPQIANDPRVATTMSIRNAALAGQQNGAVTNGAVTNGAGQNGVVSNGTDAIKKIAEGANGTEDYVSWNDMTPEQQAAELSKSLPSFSASQDKQVSTIEPEASQVGKDQNYGETWYESPGGIPKVPDIKIGISSKGPTFGKVRRDAFGKEILKESDYNKRFSELKTEAERADFQSKYSFQNAQEIADSASNMYPGDEVKQTP